MQVQLVLFFQILLGIILDFLAVSLFVRLCVLSLLFLHPHLVLQFGHVVFFESWGLH